eukprot:COSAG02_NODE_24294_length_692_cov_1.617201_1_plen_91_part_10
MPGSTTCQAVGQPTARTSGDGVHVGFTRDGATAAETEKPAAVARHRCHRRCSRLVGSTQTLCAACVHALPMALAHLVLVLVTLLLLLLLLR